MGKYGLRIRNYKAGALYGYNLGVRERYDYTDAMFNKSLFYYHMLDHGMSAYKDESTRDLICIDFGFGSRSYEEEMEHLRQMYSAADTDEARQRIQYLIDKTKENKWKYQKKSKDEIREEFYVNGVPVEYKHLNRKTGEVESTTIRYKMLYRNASKAKVGLCNFINEELYDDAYDWLTMGLGSKLPKENAKIVEISAYAPLTTSTIEDRFHLDVDNMLILEDQDSFFHTIAEIVRAEEYSSVERVVDEEKTEKNRRNALAKGRTDIYGNPIYKTVYKKIPCTKKMCVVNREEADVKNTLWDGMALIESDVMPDWCNGMVLLRNHFFKACAFRTHIQKFLRNYATEHNIDFDTWELSDMFGRKHLAKNIQIITTDNAIKWKKFVDLMGGTLPAAYDYWCERVRADDCMWGCVKTDHPSKLLYQGNVQQLSYQMVNTLPCSEKEIAELAKTSIDYVEKLKDDNEEFVKYLRANATAVNHYEMLADLYKRNPDFANSRMWKVDKSKIISQYVFRLRKGKIVVPGDNLTICGNPYALLLYTVGEDWRNDPTLQPEDGVIQCYTPKFADGEYLCGIRNPHNSANNIGYFKNVKHELMQEYFDFSNNIMAVNCIETDIQARMNGCDFDSDFFMVTNQPQMVEAAKVSYRDYPTVVNEIPESGLTYRNEIHEYAKMDSAMQQAQKAIGGSSDSAQLAQSYMWSKAARGEFDNEYQQLYHNVVILAVLAQVAIDGIKRQYAVSPNDEISRIRDMDCMKRKKDYPAFMKYTHKIQMTKNGEERPYDEIKKEKRRVSRRIDKNLVCPMNYLQEHLDKIQGSSRGDVVDTSEFFVKIKGKANNRQMSKIREVIEEYDKFVRHRMIEYADDKEIIYDVIEKTKDVLDSLKKLKITAVTMNRLVETCLGIMGKTHTESQYNEAVKYVRKTFNLLYHTNPQMFLNNFKDGN